MPRFPDEIEHRALPTFPQWQAQHHWHATPRAQQLAADTLQRGNTDQLMAQPNGMYHVAHTGWRPPAAGMNLTPPTRYDNAPPPRAAAAPAAAAAPSVPPLWARNAPRPPPLRPRALPLFLSTAGLLFGAMGVTLFLTVPAAAWSIALTACGGLTLGFFLAAWIAASRPQAQPLTAEYYQQQATAARAPAGGGDLPLGGAERAQYGSGVDVHHVGRTPQTVQALKPLCLAWDRHRAPAALQDLRRYLAAAMELHSARAEAQLAKQTLDGPAEGRFGFEYICSPNNRYQMQDLQWPTADVCAMLWDRLNHYTDPQGDTEKARSLLRHGFVRALADSRYGYQGGIACTPGQVQRLALVLQGYFPEIQIDPLLATDRVAPTVYVIGPTNKCMRDHPPVQPPSDPLKAQRAQSADLFYRRQLWEETTVAAREYYRDDPQREILCREVRELLADFFRYNYDDLAGFNPQV